MKINIILDLEQYHWTLHPIIEVCKARGHEVVFSRTRPTDQRVDASLAIQDVAYHGPRKGKEVRFFLNHGVSASKQWALGFDFDVFIAQSEYWAKHAHRSGRNFDIIAGTGYPKVDVLLQVAQKHPRQTSPPRVSFFPTYKKRRPNFAVSWARQFEYGQVVRELRRHYPQLAVFPHQMDDTKEFDKVTTIKTYGIQRLEHFVSSAVIVSDTSGCAYEACALDIPVVLMGKNHVLAFENEIVDIGPHSNTTNVVNNINTLLQDPSLFRDRRAHWRDKILGPCDGHAAERIVIAMEARVK